MKLLLLLAAVIPPDQRDPSPLFHADRQEVIANGNGTQVELQVRYDSPQMHLPRHRYTVVFTYADGMEKILPTWRFSHFDRPWFLAHVLPAGHVALLVRGSLMIVPRDQFTYHPIAMLRTDNIPDAPKVTAFEVSDLVWTNDCLVCVGRLSLDQKLNRDSCRFTFVSRMSITKDGSPRNHQVLWTTWHGNADAEPGLEAQINQAARYMEGSLVAGHNSVFWRNEGAAPGTSSRQMEPEIPASCVWLRTELTMGKTQVVDRPTDQEQSSMRARDALLLQKFQTARSNSQSANSTERLDRLIRILSSE
jgi:hypothetical protein